MSWSNFESAWAFDEAYDMDLEETEQYKFEYEQWLEECEERRESYK